MEMQNIVEFINNTGFAVVLMAYFLMKDWKFNQQILDVLAETKGVLCELKTWHEAESRNQNHSDR